LSNYFDHLFSICTGCGLSAINKDDDDDDDDGDDDDLQPAIVK